jgi:16S rRNA (adenine1518-N6/adenine1519-N6)-dimethyltransferase
VVRARKRFAQHFLEPAWVAKLVAAIEPATHDRIIEIGPGHGAITLPLAAKVDRLLAIEVDRDLVAALTARAGPNVTVVAGDVLTVDFVEIARSLADDSGRTRVRVVGNLPYNISSPILFRLIDAAPAAGLLDATLMLQAEVADRLVARPGTGEYGVLTLCTALGADVTRVLSLPPGAFRPAPKVRSAVVRLSFRPPPPAIGDPSLVVAVVRAVFTQRRKTMSNALAPFATARGSSAKDVLERAGIDPRRRPETLDLLEFGRIANLLPAGPVVSGSDGAENVSPLQPARPSR